MVTSRNTPMAFGQNPPFKIDAKLSYEVLYFRELDLKDYFYLLRLSKNVKFPDLNNYLLEFTQH
jgi:hypothetical protein